MLFSDVLCSNVRTPGDNEPKLGLVRDCYRGESVFHSKFVLRPKHKSLFSLWHEWHGTEDVSDDFGDVEGRDKEHRHQWRKHLDKQVYSRNKRIVAGIRKHAEIHSLQNPLDSIATELEKIYTTKCNCSTQRLVDYMQGVGLLTKSKMRGRAARKQAQSNQAAN
jgi:hypothetical protein